MQNWGGENLDLLESKKSVPRLGIGGVGGWVVERKVRSRNKKKMLEQKILKIRKQEKVEKRELQMTWKLKYGCKEGVEWEKGKRNENRFKELSEEEN